MDLVTMLALAVALVAGPVFASAVRYAAGEDAVAASITFVASVAMAAVVGAAVSYGVASVLGGSGDDPGGHGIGAFYKWAVVAGLLFLAVDAAVRRHGIGVPRWMGREPDPGADGALRRGVLTALATPAGVLTLLAVGEVLVLTGEGLWRAWPFWVLALVLTSVPLVAAGLSGEGRRRTVPELGTAGDQVAWLLRLVATAIAVIALVTTGPS